MQSERSLERVHSLQDLVITIRLGNEDAVRRQRIAAGAFKTLGLNVPNTLIGRADEVIE